jgi:hypothetical protein
MPKSPNRKDEPVDFNDEVREKRMIFCRLQFSERLQSKLICRPFSFNAPLLQRIN